MDIRAKKYEDFFNKKNITIYEVDLNTTQAKKKEITTPL